MDKAVEVNDISVQFSGEALEVISKACALASQRGLKVCTTAHVLEILVEFAYLKQLLKQQQFEYSSFWSQLRVDMRFPEPPVKLRSGRVVFSPDLKTTIFRSYLIMEMMKIGVVKADTLFISTLYDSQVSNVAEKSGLNISQFRNSLMPGAEKKFSFSDNVQGSRLMRFFTNLSERAREGKLAELVDRKVELDCLTRIIVRQARNNVVLVGEAGVGKSSILYLLALRSVSDNIAPQLQNIRVLEFNLIDFLSAFAAKGISEITSLLDKEFANMEQVVIFIKNFEYFSAGADVENNLTINTIRSLLHYKNVRFVLSMNNASYKKMITQRSAFSEYFEIVRVEEPSVDLATRILAKTAQKLSKFHKITIADDVIHASVEISKRYIQDKFLPSKAINLLDEASSKVVLEGRGIITIEDIKSIISEKTGIPIEKLTTSEQKKLADLEQILNKNVIGQAEAVYIVSEVVRRGRVGLKDPKGPIGSFLFLGPSGVGKTFLAKNLAQIVYDSEDALLRLDMSEFSQPHTVHRLIGSPPGYVGYEEGGQLTNPIWQRPYSLLLLDEIEKAHSKVFDIFLQVLDEGRLTDGQGRVVDFKNTIIIATSNVASEAILDKLSGNHDNFDGFKRRQFYEKEILPLLRSHFRLEFINRFDEVVLFNPLGVDALREIAMLRIMKIQERLVDKKIVLKVSDERIQSLARRAYNPIFGARPLIRLIQKEIENVLARKIISGEIKEGETVSL